MCRMHCCERLSAACAVVRVWTSRLCPVSGAVHVVQRVGCAVCSVLCGVSSARCVECIIALRQLSLIILGDDFWVVWYCVAMFYYALVRLLCIAVLPSPRIDGPVRGQEAKPNAQKALGILVWVARGLGPQDPTFVAPISISSGWHFVAQGLVQGLQHNPLDVIRKAITPDGTEACIVVQNNWHCQYCTHRGAIGHRHSVWAMVPCAFILVSPIRALSVAACCLSPCACCALWSCSEPFDTQGKCIGFNPDVTDGFCRTGEYFSPPHYYNPIKKAAFDTFATVPQVAAFGFPVNTHCGLFRPAPERIVSARNPKFENIQYWRKWGVPRLAGLTLGCPSHLLLRSPACLPQGGPFAHAPLVSECAKGAYFGHGAQRLVVVFTGLE